MFVLAVTINLGGIALSALLGAIGGGAGALIGGIIDRSRGGKPGLFTGICAAIGVVLALNIGKPASPDPDLGRDASIEDVRAAVMSSPEFGKPLRTLEARNPRAAAAFIQWFYDTHQQVLADGVPRDEILQTIAARSGAIIDRRMTRLPDDRLQIGFDLRLDMFRRLIAADTRVCGGTLPLFITALSPEVQRIVADMTPEFYDLVFGTDLVDGLPMLDDATFMEKSGQLVDIIAPDHPEGMAALTGAQSLTRDNAATYCALELDLFEQIALLPPSERMTYYRTMLKASSSP